MPHTPASAALPALEDLHSRARSLRVIYPEQYVPLDTCCKQNCFSEAGVHSCAQKRVCPPPPVIGPERDQQRFFGDKNFSLSGIRKCTVIRPKRFCSGLFKYRPFRRQTSSPSRRWLRYLECIGGICVCICILFFLSFHRSFFFHHQHHLHRTHEESWFRNASFYEIFPASFKDTDSDGYGDFQGIIQKLDYIQDLGMSAIRLNSIYSALDYPLEFEHIIDLRSVDPHLGRLEDFKTLVRECHDRGLRVVLDLNPTITSDQYTWAFHWQRGIPGYEHFYASSNRSKDPPEMENSEGPPPEDWELIQRTFGGHYALNWSNEQVQKEYRNTIRFWVELGVDGFYMKHLENLHVLDGSEIPKVLEQWRHVLDQPVPGCVTDERHRRVIIVSSKFVHDAAKRFGEDVLDMIVQHIDLVDYPLLVGNAQEMAEQISSLEAISNYEYRGIVPLWHLGSSETFRFASRIDGAYQMAAFYLLTSLSGSISIFYGDEVGLKDSYDVYSERIYRGGQLTPMLWKADNTSGGFTDNMTNPWLPLTPDHFSTSVETQSLRLSQIKTLLHFRLLMAPERVQLLRVINPNVIVVKRKGTCRDESKTCYFTYEVNLGNETVSTKKTLFVPEPFLLQMSTAGYNRYVDDFLLEPGSAYLFSSWNSS